VSTQGHQPLEEGRTTAEVLRAARERISDPERWTTREYARDAKGYPARPQQLAACRWCAVGSVCAELGLDPIDGEKRPEVEALGPAVHSTNDYHGHAATLAMFDRAIAKAEVPSV
jgi:hypothetical protein